MLVTVLKNQDECVLEVGRGFVKVVERQLVVSQAESQREIFKCEIDFLEELGELTLRLREYIIEFGSTNDRMEFFRLRGEPLQRIKTESGVSETCILSEEPVNKLYILLKKLLKKRLQLLMQEKSTLDARYLAIATDDTDSHKSILKALRVCSKSIQRCLNFQQNRNTPCYLNMTFAVFEIEDELMLDACVEIENFDKVCKKLQHNPKILKLFVKNSNFTAILQDYIVSDVEKIPQLLADPVLKLLQGNLVLNFLHKLYFPFSSNSQQTAIFHKEVRQRRSNKIVRYLTSDNSFISNVLTILRSKGTPSWIKQKLLRLLCEVIHAAIVCVPEKSDSIFKNALFRKDQHIVTTVMELVDDPTGSLCLPVFRLLLPLAQNYPSVLRDTYSHNPELLDKLIPYSRNCNDAKYLAMSVLQEILYSVFLDGQFTQFQLVCFENAFHEKLVEPLAEANNKHDVKIALKVLEILLLWDTPIMVSSFRNLGLLRRLVRISEKNIDALILIKTILNSDIDMYRYELRWNGFFQRSLEWLLDPSFAYCNFVFQGLLDPEECEWFKNLIVGKPVEIILLRKVSEKFSHIASRALILHNLTQHFNTKIEQVALSKNIPRKRKSNESISEGDVKPNM